MLKVKGVNVNRIQENFSDLINQLLSLNVQKDEITSDITYTILVCRKDFDKSRGSFFRYLYTSLENNMKRKIYAIKMKNATHCELPFGLETKKDSPLSEAVSECPELIGYALGDISDQGIDNKYLDILTDYL